MSSRKTARSSRRHQSKKKRKEPFWSGWRLVAFGGVTMVPPLILFLINLQLNPRSVELHDRMMNIDDSLLGGFLIFLVALVCPVVSAACGLGLIRDRRYRFASWFLMAVGLALVLGYFLVRQT